jgi:hypothetical protein
MPRSQSDEVKIMNAFRALPEAKREVVLNLVNAEFRPKGKLKVTAKAGGATSRTRPAARPIISETGSVQGSLPSLASITLPGEPVRQ